MYPNTLPFAIAREHVVSNVGLRSVNQRHTFSSCPTGTCQMIFINFTSFKKPSANQSAGIKVAQPTVVQFLAH